MRGSPVPVSQGQPIGRFNLEKDLSGLERRYLSSNSLLSCSFILRNESLSRVFSGDFLLENCSCLLTESKLSSLSSESSDSVPAAVLSKPVGSPATAEFPLKLLLGFVTFPVLLEVGRGLEKFFVLF